MKTKQSFFVRAGIFVLYAVFGLILFATIVLHRLTLWFMHTFTISIREIIFTVKSPLKGADTNFLKSAIAFCDIKSLVFFVVLYVIAVCAFRYVFKRVCMFVTISLKDRKCVSINIGGTILLLCVAGIVYAAVYSLKDADKATHFSEYIALQKNQTHIYEEKYEQPTSYIITGKGKNLIYIYMESMETTYASKDVGGRQESVNYMPNLTLLSKENDNFSCTENLGGFHTSVGAGWTMGALFTTSTGVPFSFPVDGNSMDDRTTFAHGITAIGDVLAQKGYTQEFLCGSDGNFAGRKQFFEQHGNYTVFDLFTAREKGYIAPDYAVWWGFEDEILYRIAKDEVTRLAAQEQPFNFTMLTVDTHHVGGYKCNICGDEYSEQLANVVACADKQVYEFVRWCQQQDFYKDTVIGVIIKSCGLAKIA